MILVKILFDPTDLEKYIANLSEESGCKKILVIGGGGKQNGNISSSLEVLQTEYLNKYNFNEVGVAGHPEGSPDISEEELENRKKDSQKPTAYSTQKYSIFLQ